MALFGKKSGKKGKDVAEIIDIEGKDKTEKSITDLFTPPPASYTEKVQRKSTNNRKSEAEQNIKAGSGNASPDTENYQAFSYCLGKNETSIHIDIRRKGQRDFGINCHLITDFQFEGENAFTISHNQSVIKFKGQNLRQIKEHLLFQRVKHLQEFDPTFHASPLPEGEAVITSIEWLQFADIDEDKT